MRLKYAAATPAAKANNTDLAKIAGNTTGIGIPKNNEFMGADSNAVINPTR